MRAPFGKRLRSRSGKDRFATLSDLFRGRGTGALPIRGGAGSLGIFAATLGLAFSAAAASAVPAMAAECPNEAIRATEITALQLPDCRAYEQVSPVDKNQNDALGEVRQVRASQSGSAVTYFSLQPFPGTIGSASFPKYMAMFEAGSWATAGTYPETPPAVEAVQFAGSTPNLTESLYFYVEVKPPSGPRERRFAVRDNQTGALEPLGGGAPAFLNEPNWGSGTQDGREFTFSVPTENLVSGVVNETGEPFLYEWSANRPAGNRLSLVGIVGGHPVPAQAGAGIETIAENSISESGERIYFTDTETGAVYLRLPATETTIPVSSGRARWRTATPDGRFALYEEEGTLYRFDSELETRLQIGSSPLAEEGNQGVLGMSADGTTVYFASPSVLAPNQNSAGEIAVENPLVTNLYVWTESEGLEFVAPLAVTTGGDQADYKLGLNSGAPAESQPQSRVDISGNSLLFSSVNDLAGYETAPPSEPEDKTSQFYLFNRTTKQVHCLTCNFAIPYALNSANLGEGSSTSAPAAEAPFLTRNLSADGSRFFFQTAESLVPADTNGPCARADGPRQAFAPCSDVYEWEAPGAGSCTAISASYSPRAGGCINLISSGTSSDWSYLGNASADGSNVFFFTRQPLVAQDPDSYMDLYDARVDGGLASQNPSSGAPASCLGEAACRSGSVTATVTERANSELVAGPGQAGSPGPKHHRKKKKPHKPKHQRKKKTHTKPRHDRRNASSQTHAGNGKKGKK